MPHKDDQEQTDGLGDTAPFQAIEEGGSSDTPGDHEEQEDDQKD